jgi:ZIP family zinc transporter
MILALIAIAACGATLLGGFFALRLKDKLHLILGFSAGAVVAVAFFDLLPEALELGGRTHELTTIIVMVAVGFFGYLTLDRILFLHSHGEDETHPEAPHAKRGSAGAGTLSLHSFLDGIGIGLAFQVSPAVGVVVAVAVLTHDFSDGINTVSYILKHSGSRARAMRWLFVDALAPGAGIIATLFFTVSQETLGLLLALFAGFFLYLGASDLIPESHHAHPKFLTTVLTLLGAGVLFAAIRLAGI